MYAAPAPEREDLARTVGSVRIEAFVHRTFPPGADRIDDAFSERHFTDLTAPFGVATAPDVAARGDANSFTTMTARLLADLPADVRSGRPPELALVAHATPDLDCRLAAVTHLADVLPGGPLAFGVSDCGSAAPFAALRLALGYARRHAYRRILLVVLDQATLPYEVTPPYESGTDLAGDAGAALLLTVGDTDAGDTVVPRPVRHVDGDGLAAAVDELVDRPVAAVLTGPGIDPGRLGDVAAPVVPAARGYPATGLLGAFAGHRDRWSAAAGPLAVVDHEPTTGELNAWLVERSGP